jgi:hypothetical protein
MERDGDLNEMRPCGWNEGELFDYVDDALSPDRASLFESHLAGCRLCADEVAFYRDLASTLDNLPSPEARPGFDEAILAAVLPAPARVTETRPVPALAARFGRLPLPLRFALGFAMFSAAVVSITIGIQAANAGGWREFVSSLVTRVVVGTITLFETGVSELLTAARISDVLMNVARSFEPLLRSVPVATDAFGAEFWLFSTLLSLLALLGAVRLATGSGVERGIGRVQLIL